MKDKNKNRIVETLLKNKFVLLVILAGVFLMLLTTGGGENTGNGGNNANVHSMDTVEFSLYDQEQRISSALSQIDGAGEVTVILTLRGSAQRVIARDTRASSVNQRSETGQDSMEQSESTVLISAGSQQQRPVALQYIYPEYLGALVVAQGADNATVRLELLNAVSSLTGLSADRITISRMKNWVKMSREVVMKRFKRNAIILTVVLFVCVAAYLNWAYNRGLEMEVIAEDEFQMAQVSPPVMLDDLEEEEDAGLFFRNETQHVSEYFAATRISRRQARDAAAETLATVSITEGASQDVIDSALQKISTLAVNSTREAELESMIMAKGFADCVVFISDDSVLVTVPAPLEGLSQISVAQITNVITTETDFRAVDLQIIEVR